MSDDTIWLVTSGCYSDYGVSAAFSTEAKAQAYANAANEEGGYTTKSSHGYGVEAYALDPDWVPRNHSGFDVFVTAAGNVETCEPIAEKLDRKSVTATPSGWWVKCFAKDKDHAIKIATEARQEALAGQASQRQGDK